MNYAEIIEFDSVDSTNNYLGELLKTRVVGEFAFVLTKEQTAGRGQVNNKWESAKGENILLSFVIYPDFIPAASQFMISKFVSLAIAEFLSEYSNNVKVKWPNDIYVNRKKIAGVLIENTIRGASISASVIGIGININQTIFNKYEPEATSLGIETSKQFNISELFEKLVVILQKWYGLLAEKRFTELNQLYLDVLYQFNEWFEYSDEKGIFKGKITGTDDFGRLALVDAEKRIRVYGFKEIKFLYS